jgi:hypothetical protein
MIGFGMPKFNNAREKNVVQALRGEGIMGNGGSRVMQGLALSIFHLGGKS